MDRFELIATAAFGLEGVVSRELEWLGAENIRTENGRVRFTGGFDTVARANLWLRTADRVEILLAEGRTETFEELFQLVNSVPFEEFMGSDAAILVTGKSVNSALYSVPDCQSVTKAAIIKRLQRRYPLERFPEDGPVFHVETALLNDVAMITLDTSGAGLHKRGYRKETGKAPIKETLAAGMLLISRWKKDRTLIDPFCGTGTIPIEAAMIAKNIAPGLRRHFDFEKWPCFDPQIILAARTEAEDSVDRDAVLHIHGSDIDYFALKLAMANAEYMGLARDISFQKLDYSAVSSQARYGFIITNPPYGERIGEEEEVRRLYKGMGRAFRSFDTWSVYVITSCKDFEKLYGRRADKKRKLYNGMLQCQLYQFFGPRPPRRSPEHGTGDNAVLPGTHKEAEA